MEQLSRTKIEKKMLIIVVAISLGMIAAGVAISVWANREATRVMTDRFNQQQLVVATGIRHQIEQDLRMLKKEAVLLAAYLDSDRSRPVYFPYEIKDSFQRVMEKGVRKIEIADPNEDLRVIYVPYRRLPLSETVFTDISHAVTGQADAASDQEPQIFPPMFENNQIILKIVARLPSEPSRAVVLHVNLNWFLSASIKPVRSGKTGYAWVIDDQGNFLYHPFAEFVGKNAFNARLVYFKEHSFEQIHRIQKEHMLKGLEGTGTYVSAWHRGITGEIQKLIAYTPIRINDQPPQSWSVAVVAPVSEIQEDLASLQLRQMAFQGLVILVIMAGSAAVLFFEVRWSKRLEIRVARRTEELKRSEEKYRSLVESAEDFIFTLDCDGRFVSVNSYTAQFLGGTPEEVVGRSVYAVFPEDVADKQVDCVESVFTTRQSVRDEFEFKTGPHSMWISVNFMPLRGQTGRMNAVLCIARDISDHKKLEKSLINTEKLASLGTLAAGVAHEINNPLGIILGFCDLLLQKKDPDSQEHQDLKIIERQGLYCKQIVENLLSFARVNQDNQGTCDVNQCLAEMITIVRHSLEMQHIEPVSDLTDNLPTVKGGFRQLQQVFLNLITNAAAAMKNGGKLTVRTHLEKSRQKVVIEIEDEGSGIPSEYLDRIYDPFFTTKPEGEGTGLGLFVSYGIIARYGGTIDCDSHVEDRVGKPSGTCFTIKLPVCVMEEA